MSMKLYAHASASYCQKVLIALSCLGNTANPARDLIVATATSDAKFVWKGP
jgi:glutathione S-transferase